MIEREEQRIFSVQVDSDGSLRAEDVPAGTYTLSIVFVRMKERSDSGSLAGSAEQLVGTAWAQVVVPEMEGGRSDQPLDIGEVKFVPWEEPQAEPVTPTPPAPQTPLTPPPAPAAPAEATSAPPPAASPAPRRYSFRHADYSLREEPQRVSSRTFGRGRWVGPEEAIVFNWPIRWWSSHWSGPRNTQQAAMVMQKPQVLAGSGLSDAPADQRAAQDHAAWQGHPRFTVLEAGKRKVWVKYFDMPIDAQQYPLLVFTYRARNIHQPDLAGEGRPYNGYVLYIDDGSGPDYGGLTAIRQGDLVDDGETRTITLDLRTLRPIGELIGLAVGLQAPEGDAGPAELDLIDLRFETLPELQEHLRFVQGGPDLPLRVLDGDGEPIAGAAVILNAERKNWARLVRTSEQGEAVLQQARMYGGPHMLRIEAAGYLPVEVRELDVSKVYDQPLEVRLPAAAPYRGQIVDAQEQPVAGAVVRVRASANAQDLWTQQEGEAITDAEGRFETPALALRPLGPVSQAHLTVHHPAFEDGHHPALSLRGDDDWRKILAAGTARWVLPARWETRTLPVILKDESGQIVQPQATLIHQQQVVRIAEGQRGAIAWRVPATRERTEGAPGDLPRPMRRVLVFASGYAPAMLHRDEASLHAMEALEMTLHRGREVQIRLTDPQGRPRAGVRVFLAQWQAWDGIPRAAQPGWTTDEQGRIRLRVASSEPKRLSVPGHPGDVLWQDPLIQLQLRIDGGPGLQRTLPVIRISPDTQEVLRVLPEISPPSQGAPSEDGRRPGYDPQRIFRRLSGMPRWQGAWVEAA